MISDISVKGTKQKIGGVIADGQWVKKAITVFNATKFTTAEVKTYTVSNYLPEDDVMYEVLVGSYAATGTKAGDTCSWWLIDENSRYHLVMGYGTTRTASYTTSGGCGIFPCTQKNGVLTLKVNITGVGSAGTSNNGLYLYAYRRVS